MELRRAGSVGGSGQTVRLAYCLNLHPGETPAEIIAGLRAVTLPLRERLAPGRVFGVGMYAPAAAAAELAHDAVASGELAAFLSDHGLDPFTWNAFPYGRFHEPGLKARVFEPTWADPERLEYTTHVARLAADLASAGFDLLTAGIADGTPGLFFFGSNGRQASAWGNGTSLQCVVPPVQRLPILTTSSSTSGTCDGGFGVDLNTHWNVVKPAQNPGAGAVVQAQVWYRDPASTSNQTTSLSNALEFTVCP